MKDLAQAEDPRVLARDFTPDGVGELDLYQKREKIYTRKVKGYFQRLRLLTGWPLLIGYFLLPWLNWGEFPLLGYGLFDIQSPPRQAVLFDLPARQFHILGLTFWPQDFPLLALVLIIAAFGLFALTAWAGRVWCGYTCPQTVWTAVFMWAEQLCEGSRNQRIKRDQGPMTTDKLLRKSAKHIMWLGFAFLTGFTFVGYFSPIRDMALSLGVTLSYPFDGGAWLQSQWEPPPDLLNIWEFAWINFFTLATYCNAGWMREQVCLYMCPYARFQSVMFDSDTLIVSYDAKRGEPRGSRKRRASDNEHTLGDCVDCQICVQVCPTGIDIRNGLQYECINCALCIDACDSVMQQMNYAPRLISYTTENRLQGKPERRWRPRLVGYSLALLLMLTLLVTLVWTRVPLRLDVIRDRDELYTSLPSGLVENNYTLKLINMSQQGLQLDISAALQDANDSGSVSPFHVIGETQVYVDPGEVLSHPLSLQVMRSQLAGSIVPIVFSIHAEGTTLDASKESRFFLPTESE